MISKNIATIAVLSYLNFIGLYAQTAEQKAAENYVQNTSYSSWSTVKGSSYYLFNGKKFTEEEVFWSGETAVMNSNSGSFQVWLRQIPTATHKYSVKPYLTFSSGGPQNEASVVLIDYDYDSKQYWSIIPNSGTVSVKVKKNAITITVKNVKLCINNTNECKNISGNIFLKKGTQ